MVKSFNVGPMATDSVTNCRLSSEQRENLPTDSSHYFTKKGITDVLRPGAKFEQLASNLLFAEKEEQPETKSKAEKPEKQAEKPKSNTRGGGYPQLSPTIYGTAAVDGSILIRTGTELYCIGSPQK